MRNTFSRLSGFLSYCAILTLTASLCSAQTEAPPKVDKPTIKPGRDRWEIKTAADRESREIDPKPEKSTVEKLLAIPRPVDYPLDGSNPFFQSHRARPAEMTVFSVEADVIDCRLMPDGDYRVTIRGASGKTMVLEMPKPDPEFVDPTSKFAPDIKAAREQFDKKFKPETKAAAINGHARISGIGFFGRTYNGRKAEGNLIQLHPVLKIQWMNSPSREFKAVEEKSAENSSDKPADVEQARKKP